MPRSAVEESMNSTPRVTIILCILSSLPPADAENERDHKCHKIKNLSGFFTRDGMYDLYSMYAPYL